MSTTITGPIRVWSFRLDRFVEFKHRFTPGHWSGMNNNFDLINKADEPVQLTKSELVAQAHRRNSGEAALTFNS